MTTQPTPATVLELQRQGLTAMDIARMLGLHPKAVKRLIEEKRPREKPQALRSRIDPDVGIYGVKPFFAKN